MDAGRLFRLFVFACLIAPLASCASITVENTQRGKLNGELKVVWVGEDSFVYVGGPGSLSFLTSKGKLIKPNSFYTDGGSIPGPVRALDGFSPWGYAPAYIIHDWLFAQNDCDPEYLKRLGIDFAEANQILAEVIKTLIEEKQVRRNDAAFSAISWAVTTSIARKAWDEPTAPCSIKPRDRVNIAVGPERGASTQRLGRRTPSSRLGEVVFRRTYGR